MLTALFILLVIICAVLAFFVLIQNPKGGGLSGSFGGIGTQMMGAKQSTDVVEKGTWIAAAVLVAFTLASFVIAPKKSTKAEQTQTEKALKGAPSSAPAPAPANAPATAPATTPGTAPAATPAPAEGASKPQ